MGIGLNQQAQAPHLLLRDQFSNWSWQSVLSAALSASGGRIIPTGQQPTPVKRHWLAMTGES